MSLPWGTYLSLNTAPGLPGHPLRFMGVPLGVMGGLQQGCHSQCPNVPSLSGCIFPAVTPQTCVGQQPWSQGWGKEVGKVEKKQDEGGRKAVAELGVLFGLKTGGCWCGPVQCECLGWHKGACAGRGVAGLVISSCSVVPACSLQLLQEVQETTVPLIGLVQVAGVSCTLQHQHLVLREVFQVVQTGLPQLRILVPVHDQRGGL